MVGEGEAPRGVFAWQGVQGVLVIGGVGDGEDVDGAVALQAEGGDGQAARQLRIAFANVGVTGLGTLGERLATLQQVPA